MTLGMIKCILYAIALWFIQGIIECINKKSDGRNNNQEQYVLQMPVVLNYVYKIVFFAGLILFLIFLLFMLNRNPTVTMGHLWFSLIFSGIGLSVMIWTSRWKISVDDSTIEIRRIFHRNTELSMQDINHVEIGKKDELIIYGKNDTKLFTIGPLTDNYDRFMESMKKYEKIKV